MTDSIKLCLYERRNSACSIRFGKCPHWTVGIPKSKRNAVVNSPGHLIDLMVTCVDDSKAAYPKEFWGENIQPMEGISLVPALLGKDFQRTTPLA